jgi:hypothetical protein
MENNSNILANFSPNGDLFVSPNEPPNLGFLVTKFQEKKKTHHLLSKIENDAFFFFWTRSCF